MNKRLLLPEELTILNTKYSGTKAGVAAKFEQSASGIVRARIAIVIAAILLLSKLVYNYFSAGYSLQVYQYGLVLLMLLFGALSFNYRRWIALSAGLLGLVFYFYLGLSTGMNTIEFVVVLMMLVVIAMGFNYQDNLQKLSKQLSLDA